MPEQATGIVLRVPLDRATDNRTGADLNVGVDHIDVPVVVDPGLDKRGEFQNTYGGTRIVLREWNEQVLLHELLHAALVRIPQIWADDEHNHNIISRVEVALWETGWRFARDIPPEVIDRVSRLLCERHQIASPTRQPCAACVQDATECILPPEVGKP